MNVARTRPDIDSVSVQIINSGDKGSLVGALNFTNNLTGVDYDIPLRDSGTAQNSAGGYPVRLDDDYTTVLSITNVGDKAGKFTMQINYDGGVYAMYPRELAAGATAVFDIRKIRDEQRSDNSGRMLPVDLIVGQIRWSQVGGSQTRLMGRSEIISKSGKVSSSYSCGVCCPNGFGTGGITPYTVFTEIGGFEEFTANQQDQDCYGNLYSWYPVTANWTTDNSSIALMDANIEGRANAIDVGETFVRATWDAEYFADRGSGACDALIVAAAVAANINVRPKVEILRDGQVISNTTTAQSVIVGQRINLSARINSGIPSSQQWTIPEKAIEKFETLDSNNMPDNTRTPAKGNPAAIPSNKLTSANVDFIWYSGGGNDASKQVTYTATINGRPYTASANFNVKRPTVSLTSVGGTTKVDNAVPELYLGGVTSADTGIVITRSNTIIPTGFTGSFQFVQLINAQVIRTPTAGTIPNTNLIGLDGCYPYVLDQTSMNDKPTVGLASQSVTLQYAEYNGQWSVYLMFKPSGTGSDWVPIQKLNWAWHGSATLVANSNPRQWTPNNITAPGNPSGVNTTDYPVWTNIVLDSNGCNN